LPHKLSRVSLDDEAVAGDERGHVSAAFADAGAVLMLDEDPGRLARAVCLPVSSSP
jgi:hypothetical protein